MTSFSTNETITTYSTREHPRLGTTSFVTKPTKTTTNSEMTITSSWSIKMSPSKSINTNARTNTSKDNDEGPATDKAVYWGIGGGVGSLALISIGILVRNKNFHKEFSRILYLIAAH